MVEIEVGVLVKQCLDRRIADRDTLRRELASWQRRRNAQGARIKWLFDVRRAREKLGRVYPTPRAKFCSVAGPWISKSSSISSMPAEMDRSELKICFNSIR